MISEQPLDMSRPSSDIKPYLEQSSEPNPEETSPPPLTKLNLVKPKTVSSPKDFFAKLYGPDESKSGNPTAAPVVSSILTNMSSNLGFSPYLSHYPDPTLFRFDSLPLPGGLAAFREYFSSFLFRTFCTFFQIVKLFSSAASAKRCASASSAHNIQPGANSSIGNRISEERVYQ